MSPAPPRELHSRAGPNPPSTGGGREGTCVDQRAHTPQAREQHHCNALTQKRIPLKCATTAQIATACTAEDTALLHGQVLNLHGDVLLMLHWSMLAYTGLVKILKKYHKRTGKLLHAPDMTGLLSHPFCSTEVRTPARARSRITKRGGPTRPAARARVVA